MSETEAPKLSIVATARNDDHGGNLLRRMQIFVTGCLEQSRRHGLDAELIVVEWNPPGDRPKLSEALRWPSKPGPCAVRIVEVSPELHRRFEHSDKLPLFQMIAKNAGIRRARGEFVLATNIDLLFSDELVRFLASGNLSDRCIYRIDRHDVPADVPIDAPIEQQLEYCRNNVVRVNTKLGTFTRQVPPRVSRYAKRVAAEARDLRWLLPHRLPRGVSLRATMARRCELLKTLARRWVGAFYSRLHTNACGDFTLLARKRWFELRGYPEWEMFSFHLDSILCQIAHYAGLREVVIPEPSRLYHIEHGSGWTPIGDGAMKERIRKLGLPMLDGVEYEGLIKQMRRERRPIVCNGEDWGLAGEHLRETVIGGG